MNKAVPSVCRLAVVLSHPVQYYSPWFRHLATRHEIVLKVFYLWNSGVETTVDRTFGTAFAWDIPLMDGYQYQWLPNASKDPGTHHFGGLHNPGAVQAIAAWKPDALLLFGYTYRTHLRLMLSPTLRRVPFLFRGDSHVLYGRTSLGDKLSGLVRKLLFRRFRKFLAVGIANTQYFQHHGVPTSKIARVPHCVDNVRFQSSGVKAEQGARAWKESMGIPAGATVILFAGKFEKKKCPLELMRAFLQLASRTNAHSNLVVLLLVGSGPQDAELRNAAGDQIGNTVWFAPFQNQSEMPKVYAAGDVLVLPSFGKGETWGLAVNEAMNLSRPVVVSSHVGCAQDLVEHGKTGWVFPAGDWMALQATLETAVSDPARLRGMGKAAREKVSGFSYEEAGNALCSVLRQL